MEGRYNHMEGFSEGKRKLVIADISEAVEAKAKDVALEKSTESAGKPKGFLNRVQNFGKNVWKRSEIFQTLERHKAEKEIKQSGNLFTYEKGKEDKEAHQREVDAITRRFSASQEFEDEFIHKAAGEFRSTLGDSEKENAIKNQLQILIKAYARGSISEAEFHSSKEGIFFDIRGLKPEELGKGKMYADNLFEIANAAKEEVRWQVEQRVSEDEAINNLDLDFEVVIGKVKAGVRSEAQFSAIDKIVDKIQRSTGGVFSEKSVAVAVAIANTFASKIVAGSVKKAAMVFGVGMAASGATAAARESRKLEVERMQHARERAQGKEVEDARLSKRRAELEASRIQTKNVEELQEQLEASLFNKLQSKEAKDLTQEEYNEAMQALADIEARIQISDTGIIKDKKTNSWQFWKKDSASKVDLISYSNISKVDQERTSLDISKALAKVQLKKAASALGKDFKVDLSAKNDKMFKLLFEGDKGILKQNEIFHKLKKQKVWKAFLKGALIGGAVGLIAQEANAFANHKEGSVEHLWHTLRGDHTPHLPGEHVTLAEGVSRRAQEFVGPSPHGTDFSNLHDVLSPGGTHHFKLPDGYEIMPDGLGGYQLFDHGTSVTEPFKLNPDGSLTPEAQKYLAEHGFGPHADLGNKIPDKLNAGHIMTLDETNQKFPGLSRHARADWHDNPGQHYSNVHHKLIEFEGKQQNLYLEQGSDGTVYIDAKVVVKNVLDNLRDKLNDPDFGVNPDSSFDQKLIHMRDQLKQWADEGTLEDHLQAAIIPTEAANKAGLSYLVEGASTSKIALPKEYSDMFTDPSMLRDGKLPFKFLELRIDGHVLATAKGGDVQIAGGTIPTTVIGKPENPVDFITHSPNVLPFLPRKGLEAMRPEMGIIYGYGYGRESARQQEEREKVFKQHRSKNLLKNPEAKLDHFKEIENYFARQNRKYMRELKEISEQLGTMGANCKLSICIPVAGHQEGNNIYNSLKNYTHQTADKKDYEIVLLVNHPEVDKQGKEVKPDKTLKEIERFKRDFPDMPVKVMYKVLPLENAKIGYVRKVLNDAVLYRQHGRGSSAPDLIMVSNDADNKGVAPEYIKNFIDKFDSHPNAEGFLGQLDWDPEAYTKEPVVHIGTRFFQYMNIHGRKKASGVMVSSGANFAFRSSIYAGVGGYLDNALDGGEDINLGWAIASARGQYGNYEIPKEKRVIQFAGPKVSRVYTSARRAIHSWQKHGLAPVHQWDKGFSAFDNEVRAIDAGGGQVDYGDPSVLNKLKYDIEKVLNRTLDDYVQDPDMTSKDHHVYKNIIGHLGIQYKLNTRGNLVITDMTSLVAGLKEYQEFALAQRKAKSGDTQASVEFKTIRQRQAAKRAEKGRIKQQEQNRIEEETNRKMATFYSIDRLAIPDLPEGIKAEDVVSAGNKEDLGDYEDSDDIVISANKDTGKVVGGRRKADGRPVVVKRMTDRQVKEAKESSFRSKEVDSVESYLESKNFTSNVVLMPEKIIRRANELVRVYEAGVSDLDSFLQAGHTLSPRNAISLMLRICDGVRALHKLEVVHGDIAPSNIILFKDGAKLGDLDGASVDTSGKGSFGRKIKGGNRFVMAPEMFKGKSPRFGKTADIYEAGVTLFRLITGKWPYDIESTATRRMNAEDRMNRYKKLHESGNMDFPPNTPAGIEPIIRKAMAPTPADRYASMDEMVSALADAYQTV